MLSLNNDSNIKIAPYLFIYLLYKIVLEVQQQKLKIKNI